MSGATEKQGYLGDLSDMSDQQLKELLLRQNKLLSNIKFINKLPDKGEKITGMVKRIEAALATRKEIDDTADLFQKMALNADQARRQAKADEEAEELRAPLQQIINKANQEKMVIDKRQPVNVYDKISRKADERKPPKRFYPHRTVHAKDVQHLPIETLNRLTLNESSISEPSEKVDNPLNDNRVSESEQGSNGHTSVACPTETESKQNKDFHENESKVPLDKEQNSCDQNLSTTLQSENKKSDINSSKDKQTTQNQTKTPPKGPGKLLNKTHGANTTGKLKYEYDESLECSALWKTVKHESVKAIPLQEALTLQKEQKKNQEVLQSKLATEKLAKRLHITMETFQPEGDSKTRYRDAAKQQSDEELDSDDEEVDYP